jgi:diguanylate cyclase (GGDEF)-like protein
MINFDLKTIVFMSMLLTFMLSMLLAITRKHHKEVNGPGYWAVGNLVIGLGMVLVLIQLDTARLFFLPGIALIGAGLGLYINGIQAFNGTFKTVDKTTDNATGKVIGPDHHIPIIIFVLLTLVDTFFVLVNQDIRMAVILGAVIFAAIYLYCARLTLTREEGILGDFYWIASSLYMLMMALMFGRAIYASQVDIEVFDSFATWPVNSYTFMLGAVSQFFISSLFVLMLSYKLNRSLESIATIDSLTNVLNRRGLEDASIKVQDMCKRINLSMAVLLIDIDYFKKVNDNYGHLVGDDVLRHIAKTIGTILRSSDVLGRYGGEEFCAFLPNTTEHDALGLAERIRIGIETTPIKLSMSVTLKTTVSIGVADSVRAGYDFKDLLAAADSAMYGAKNGGRNRVMSYTEITRDTKQD